MPIILQVLIQTPKGWHYENWSGETEKDIIRLEGEDRVDRVVLLYTNPEFEDNVKFNVTIDTTVEENVFELKTNAYEIRM